MYTPLFVKTDYSLLSSLIKIDDLIENLKKKIFPLVLLLIIIYMEQWK